jgi:hypothetical protein
MTEEFAANFGEFAISGVVMILTCGSDAACASLDPRNADAWRRGHGEQRDMDERPDRLHLPMEPCRVHRIRRTDHRAEWKPVDRARDKDSRQRHVDDRKCGSTMILIESQSAERQPEISPHRG